MATATQEEPVSALRAAFQRLRDVILPLGTSRGKIKVITVPISEEIRKRTSADALANPLPFPDLK
jgi:hypothetical protein